MVDRESAPVAPVTPGRPVWLLGVSGVLDGWWSRADPTPLDLTVRGPNTKRHRVYRELVDLVVTALDVGVDTRWLTSRGHDFDEFLAAVELAYPRFPRLPEHTDLDLPDGYAFPGGGWTGTAGRVMWQADAVRHLVPDTSPLLWTPEWDYLSESSAYQCGDPARGRRPADVVDSRSGSTTIITPTASPRLSYMTKGDLKTIDRWIDQHERARINE